MSHIERVKQYLRAGKAAQLAQWAKENKIPNIEALIDQAARELKEKR